MLHGQQNIFKNVRHVADSFIRSKLITENFKAHWSLYVPHSGHYMYHQVYIQQFYVLTTVCVCVVCGYFPVQH